MKGIFNICPYAYYRNEQFMKDCILIPYTISKLYGYQATIVTKQKEEFTYLPLLPDLQTDIVPNNEETENWTNFCTQFISKNYKNIDLLFCFGSYEANQAMVPLYKKLRPDGKVILKLDANSGWMDRLSMSNESLYKMYENCDLITCESKRLKEHLSKKWPFQIDYVVNGSLDNLFLHKPSSYQQKENILLTVGRIGTAQKANHILLEAFAMYHDCYPDWTLRLVGSVEPSFEPYINDYFSRYPELIDRVILTGKITDKEKLYEEYQKAKVFAITSVYEGGTPNVFSEAAYYGCYTICSDIDASYEFTNGSKCGSVFPVGDSSSLAEILKQVLSPSFEPVLESNFAEIQTYHHRFFNYETIAKKLMHLLTLKEEIFKNAEF